MVFIFFVCVGNVAGPPSVFRTVFSKKLVKRIYRKKDDLPAEFSSCAYTNMSRNANDRRWKIRNYYNNNQQPKKKILQNYIKKIKLQQFKWRYFMNREYLYNTESEFNAEAPISR